jgi:PAS domain S-box-containing protein
MMPESTERQVTSPDGSATADAAEAGTAHQAQAYLQSIADTVREPLVVLDADLRVMSANRSFYETFRVDPKPTEGQLLYEVGDGQWDLAQLRRLLEEILPGETHCDDFPVDHTFPHLGHRILLLNARKLYRSDSSAAITLLAIEDVTERRQAEEAVRASQQLLATTLRSIGDAVIATDTEGCITFMNPVAEQLTGWRESEGQGKDHREVFRLVNAATSATVESPVNRVIRDGVTTGLANHTLLIARDGARLSIEECGAPIRDEQGDLRGVVLVFRDISERQRAEQVVQQARAYAESIVDTVYVPLVVLDRNLRVVSANRAFYQAFRVAPEQTENQFFYEIGDGQWNLPELRRLLQEIVPRNRVFNDFPVDRVFPRLGRRSMLLNARRLYSPGNKTELLLLAIEDITEGKQAANALLVSEMRYRRLFEAARDGILLLDSETGKITDANPFMEELLGYTHDELVGKELWEIGLFSDREASRTAFRQLQAQRYIRYEDLPLETRRGGRREVEFVSNVYAEDGTSVVQCNIRDITERKRLEEARQVALERERRIAETLQRPLTLEIAEDAFPGLSVATLYEAASDEAHVGGDFFDAFSLPGGHVALAVADESGKGLSAAVRTMQVKDVLRAFAREYPQSPAAIMAHLNNFVCDTGSFDNRGDETFTCLLLVILDPATGEGMMVSAGCEPPLVLRASGGVDVLQAANLALGIERVVRYTAIPLCLRPGDTLLMVTDGIPEARRDGEFLGYEGMVELARQALASPTLREMGQAILAGARAFGNGSLSDDTCLLLARRR